MVDIQELARAHKELVINTRRALHRIPETGYTEKKTSAYVADYLSREGLEVQTGIAQFGVVGLLKTGRPGPTLLIRADMDALPLQEDTGLEFASTHKGVMHACGHDAHMAMGLAAATILNKIKDDLNGTVKFVFQPAEEGPGGAEPMIKAGVMEDPKVDYAFGCHVWPYIPEGTIGVRSGPFMAAMDRYDLKIIGKGGHGAMPHLGVDALEIGTQVVSALQRIASRHINPLEPVVVTVGTFHAGTNFNIICGEAVLSGTTRTFDLDIWHSWQGRLEKVICGVCESMGAEYEFKFSKGYPPTINDEAMSDLVRRCAAQVVGPDKVVEPEKTMGGEDMSFFLQQAKGCYYVLGTGRDGGPPIHNAKFTFNEDILTLGVETHCRLALELLGK